MKWRMHSNLVVNSDIVAWASCAHKRELIKLFFIRRAGGWGGNDVTFFNCVTFLSRTKDCTSCVEKNFCSHLGLLFARSSVCSQVVSLWFAVRLVSHFPQGKYRACDLLRPEGSACVPLLVYFICSRTRSPRLWVVNHGNSCT